MPIPRPLFLGFVIAAGSIQMDPGKVAMVNHWPHPESRKQLQQFLGFPNFYRRFIRNYSTVVVPLMTLMSSKRDSSGRRRQM